MRYASVFREGIAKRKHRPPLRDPRGHQAGRRVHQPDIEVSPHGKGKKSPYGIPTCPLQTGPNGALGNRPPVPETIASGARGFRTLWILLPESIFFYNLMTIAQKKKTKPRVITMMCAAGPILARMLPAFAARMTPYSAIPE